MSRRLVAVAIAAGAAAACGRQPPAETAKQGAGVDPRQTQAPADELLNYTALMERLRALEASPRVQLVSIGKSGEGRDIPMVVITEPPVDVERLAASARRLAVQDVAGDRLSNLSLRGMDVGAALAGTRLPVMLAGASWGHEAAQVEGLLLAAEQLVADSRPQTTAALGKVVALIIPLMNPDGRERSIAEWRATPLSTGASGIGNANGFMLNRDFIHDTQPESHAIIAASMKWRPVVALDMHEDMFTLGVGIPEVAFVPPFMPGLDVEEEPVTRAAIAKVGDAVARRWRDAGYRVAYDAAGSRQFAPMPAAGSGQLNPVAGSSGRLEFLWSIHGGAGLITESGRTPGSQPWKDRVNQKTLAALAAIDVVAGDPAFFATAMHDRLAAAGRAGLDGGEFVVIPEDQPRGADVEELRRLLAVHDVRVYASRAMKADVVPLGQGESAFIRHALLAERSKLNDLPSALGVRILRGKDLDAAAQAKWRQAVLEPRPSSGAADAWPAKPTRTLKVGVYRGQGLDGPGPGELVFVLRWLGFEPIPLTADDVKAGRWQDVGAVVIADGDPGEIVNGDDPQAPGRRAPWQPAGPRSGLGSEGLDAISSFVRGGGRLIALGRSTALAGEPHLKLARLRLASGNEARPGIGQVSIRPSASAAWLFDGVARDSAGTSRAFLWAPPGAGAPYLFSMEDTGQTAAAIVSAITTAADLSFVDPAMLDAAKAWTAIGVVPAERGTVVLFSIAPTFRAQWRSTFPLLANAIAGKTR